jgi:hypothetical protein
MQVEVEYNNLFEYVSMSQDVDDFADRFSDVVNSILIELNKRLENCYFKYKAMNIIDVIQEEIAVFVSDVNSAYIIENQPFVVDSFLLTIIQFNHQELFNDYMYAKYVMPN